MSSREEIAEQNVAIKQLRQARTKWHEDFGVSISFQYAAFLTAIGLLEDALIDSEVARAELEGKLKEYSDEVAMSLPTFGRVLGEAVDAKQWAVSLEEKIKDLQAERQRLRDALAKLIRVAESGGNFGQVCNGCRRNILEFSEHTEDCPVLQARTLLASTEVRSIPGTIALNLRT